MEHNMGTVDRLLRTFIVVPLAIVLSFAVFGAGSVLGIVALVVAAIMLATSAVGFCPGYLPFGISTRGGISTHGHVRFGGHPHGAVQH
jgi:Inner membrane protein YgaP-like, transmembrane domain